MSATIAKDKLLTAKEKQACKQVASETGTNVIYVGLLAELYKTEPGEGKYPFGIPDSTSIRALAESEFGWSIYKRNDTSTHDGQNELDQVTNGLIAAGLLVKRVARGGRPFVQWDDGRRSARPAVKERLAALVARSGGVSETSDADEADDTNNEPTGIELKEVRAIGKQIVKVAGLKTKTKTWLDKLDADDYEDLDRAAVIRVLCESLCGAHPKAQHTAILTAGYAVM